MNKWIKQVSAGVWLLLSVVMTEQASASQLVLAPMDEVIPRIHCVLRIKVTHLEHGLKFMALRDGSRGPSTSSSITVSGTVQATVWGPCMAQKIQSEYTETVPIMYDEMGKVKIYYSPIILGSGREFNLKTGEEYLLSFSDPLAVGKAGETPLQHHFRVDPASFENTLMPLLKSRKGD